MNRYDGVPRCGLCLNALHVHGSHNDPCPPKLQWETIAGILIDRVNLTPEDYVNEEVVLDLKRFFGGSDFGRVLNEPT